MKKLIVFLFVGFLSLSLHAQVVVENLSFSKATSSKVATSDLSKLKTAELGKKWPECVMLARKSFSKNPDIKPWILISWLKCSTRLAEEKKGTESLIGAIKAFEPNKSFLVSGPWKNKLREQMLAARFQLLDIIMKNHAQKDEAWNQINALLALGDLLDNEQSAKIYMWAGELAQGQTQLKAALNFYEKSLAERETRAAREKYNAVLFTLDKSKVTAPEASQGKADLLSEAEGKFEERINSALKTNDLVALVDDSVSYLAKFPNGKRAKWAQEKVLDIYTGVSDRSSDDKMYALKEKILSSMAKADGLRVLEWSRALHRRADFPGALKLSEKALDDLKNSSQGAVLLYIAGRSAQLSGDYKKARKFFEDYIEFHSGADDLNEVLFRLGLVHLREQQFSSASATFEKLLVQNNIDRYELSSRYWLVRSLQATNNKRATEEIDVILSQYPFSYYALKLKSERSNGILDWPTELKQKKTISTEVYWAPAEKKVWDRIKFLSAQGWMAEALAEYLTLQMPKAATDKILTAQTLAAGSVFPPVIRLVNEAGDLDPSLRSLDIVTMSFPQAFKVEIEAEAKKQKLSPLLVRSLIRQESAYGVQATSSSNALGLMQLIPPTAVEVAKELNLSNIEVPADVYIPDINVQMGTYYIAKMIRQFGKNVPLGLAAYNAGPTRMKMFVSARSEVSSQIGKKSYSTWDELWYDELPWFETSFYVKSILRNSLIYKLIERQSEKNPDQRRVAWSQGVEGAPWGDLVLPE